MRRARKIHCPQCGATNYPTDPVCLSCGADLTPPPPKPALPTPVTPGPPSSWPSGTPRTGGDEFRYGAIGALVGVAVAVVLLVIVSASGDHSHFPGAAKVARCLVLWAMAGAVLGAVVARFRSQRGSADTDRESVRGRVRAGIWVPFLLWGLLIMRLAMDSTDRAARQPDNEEVNVLWLVLVVALAIGAFLVMNALGFLAGLLGDISAVDSWSVVMVILAIALVFELLMFLVWPSNAGINAIAVLATAALMGFYYFKRDLFND